MLRTLLGPALLVLATRAAAGELPSCAGPVSSQALRALHAAEARPRALQAAPADRDVDGVAVLEDRGDLVVRRNPFDLTGGLRFTPVAGGFAVQRTTATLPSGGTALPAESAVVELPFAFPFYGERPSRVHVHADGHLTFGEPDPVAPSVPRLFEGPPRVAALYADLDPARGGTVSAVVDATQAAFVWRDIPSAFQVNRNTFGVVLHADGVVELIHETVQAADAWVGLTPGRGATPETAVDLSAGGTTSGPVLERFSDQDRVDLVAVTARFEAGHDRSFDQVAVYTTRALNPLGGTLAFEITIRNATAGIGTPVFDDAAAWGAGPALQSVVFMDAVRPYRDVDGFEVLGHEVGHRWLASLRFAPQGFGSGTELMTGDGVHWSFFFDSDASVMGGNDYAAVGGSRFESVDVARGFGPLDQYAMGLRAPSDVPALHVYDVPDQFQPPRTYKSSTSPEVGVSFSAFERSVAAGQVVAAMGARLGPASETAVAWRLAFVLVADAQAPASAEQLLPLARIRRNFEGWFREGTAGRGSVTTSLP